MGFTLKQCLRSWLFKWWWSIIIIIIYSWSGIGIDQWKKRKKIWRQYMVNDIDFDTRSVPTNQKKKDDNNDFILKSFFAHSWWEVNFFFCWKNGNFHFNFFFTFFIFLQFKKPLPITYSKRIFEFYLDSFYHYHVSVWLVGCLPPYNHSTNKIQFSFFFLAKN